MRPIRISRSVLLILLTAVYLLLMHLLSGTIGAEIRIITVLPALVWSIAAGLRRGIAYALVCALIITPLYMALRFGLSLEELYLPNIPGILATVIVSGIVGAYRDLHLKIRALNRELRSLNRTDSLTGLLNRRGVFETAERIFDIHLRRRRSGLATQPFACAILDLDHFKEINDRHGHLTGDTVLRKIGALLSEHFRGTDIVGRCGGEEFLLILPDTDAEAASRPLEKLAEKVRGTDFRTEKGESLAVRFSGGVTEVSAKDDSFDELFARADSALYAAKDGGRDRTERR